MKAARSNFGAENHRGFTLIEICITLIIMSIFATLLIQFSTTASEQSTDSVVAVQQELALTEIMEKMTADYQWILKTDQTPLATFQTRIENGNVPANSPYFGAYEISTRYINFIANGPTLEESEDVCTTGCNTLKVTISRDEFYLTALFTR